MTNNQSPDMPEEIFLEPKPATWGAMLFSEADPKNGRAIRYVRADLIKPEPVADLKAALNCTIEHLDGAHEGKIVVDREVFETLYEAASSRLRPAVPRDIRADDLDVLPTEVIEKAYWALARSTPDIINTIGYSGVERERARNQHRDAIAALKPYVEGK